MKHVRFEAGDGNGNPRGVRLTVLGAISICMMLITFGGGVVSLVRGLDPQVTQAKIDRVVMEMEAADKAIASKIEAERTLTDQQFAANEARRVYILGEIDKHFASIDRKLDAILESRAHSVLGR